MKIKNTMLDLIGGTPLVRINKLNTGNAEIFAKVELFNPAGSVKDRIAAAMIEDAEKNGKIATGTVIIEPTSGNTGIGLAFVAAIKGYRLILTMPETMSIERRKVLAAYGAELVLTPGKDGMKGAIAEAIKLAKEIPQSYIPQQFENPANPAIHAKTTAEEIWNDTDGSVDVFIAGVGTGGSITGIGKRLKELKPSIEIVAVEPDTSAVLSGEAPGPHKLQGIGAGFIPTILETSIIDKILKISAEEAAVATRELPKKEGMFVGISSGAAFAAALKLSNEPAYAKKRIVVLLPDTGMRYLSSYVFE